MVIDFTTYPGNQAWTWLESLDYINDQSATFIFEKTGPPQAFGFQRDRNSMEQGMNRLINKAIDVGELDPATWILLGSYASFLQKTEFSYLSYHMAHLLEH